jgi:plastocyanin
MSTGTQFVLNGASTDAISVIVGQQVAFRNIENTAHDIYSVSPLKTFDTGVLQNGESQTVLFDRAGILDVQCAIHPEMRLTVRVED